MRVGLGQLASGHDVDANLRAIDGLAARAAADGARLLVLPEYATYEKKTIDASFPAVAEPLDGPVCSALARTARRHGVALVAGVVESSDDPGRAHNTLVAFERDGTLLAAYRKIHLFDAQGFRESRFIKPAPEPRPVLFDLGGVRFGMMTCYDLRFPEHARALSDAGARALLVSASWVPGELKTRQWQTLTAARAIENGLYVAGVCQAAPISVGHSVLVDPRGGVVAELGTEAGLRVADLDPLRVDAVRGEFPMSRQRRI
ncbi:MAG: carbon-nitrogen hydrolase family protein [Arthrobacter sp.]|uniref:carbon-nitrogen hydrolase family protein n=1 Tax=Arthrobacter sp. TaxID=1667 RepID=UPI00347B27CF